MVPAAGLRVVPGELDAVAFDMVDGADRLAVGADDFHVLSDEGGVHATFSFGSVR